ncbi:aminopeptidase N-like isoform X2 [Chrysoperla carnea]|uniref:aminopeptidase N-like isoform X2 n=1 Tax=Chrysoperla carnea TaxID=189513 RepID=UPI001D09838B|nr:aminopeptidase N-like isoform X2 [Chrysoperla carnea]
MPPLARAEFEIDSANYRSSDNDTHLRISRDGGFFVSYVKACLFAIIIIACLMAVGLLTYYLSPGYRFLSRTEAAIEEDVDLAILDLDSHHSSQNEKLYRLSNKIIPQHYRLKFHPIFDEDPDNKFTFTGDVKITILVNDSNINTIEFHSQGLDIKQDGVKVAMLIRQSAPLTPISQIKAENNTTNETDFIFENTRIGNDTKTENNEIATETITPENDSIVENNSSRQVTNENKEFDLIFASSTNIKIVKQEYQNESQKYILHLETALKKGRNYTIFIPFSGEFGETLEGFYRVTLQDEEGNTKYYAVTQFEPTFARTAFPCFDEPKFKSTFDISIGRREDMVSLSNTDKKAQEPMTDKPTYIWDHYETTPVMSTYLVAFAVGDFLSHNFTSKSKQGVIITVSAERSILPKEKTFIEYIAAPIFDYYMDLFQADYPFKKLDILMCSIAGGGMENWGLITLSDDFLVVNDSSTNQKVLEPIFTVVSHEIVHQWIGNLVSIKWWADAWLKEGLASYFEMYAMQELKPDWKPYDTFLLTNVNFILSVEMVKSKNPVSVEVLSPLEITQRFDDIIYQKGACLYRMLNNTLTEPVFLNGIRHYLKSRSYKTGTENNLWESLNIAAKDANITVFHGMDVQTIMDAWIHKPGIPLVTVGRNYSTGIATVSQQRFLLNNETDDTLWYIPLTYITDTQSFDNQNRELLSNKKSMQIYNGNFKRGNNTKWVLFNPLLLGLYRVNYDLENWNLLKRAILSTPEQFPPPVKYQLMDDSFSMAQVGLVDYTLALNFSTAMVKNEEEYSPWHVWYENIEFLDRLLSYRVTYGLFQEYIISMVGHRYSKPKENPTPEDEHLQDLFTELACKYEYNPCINWALQEFEKLKGLPANSTNPIDPNVREYVYCTAIAQGGKFEWDLLWQRSHVVRNDPHEHNTILVSLTCSTSKWILRRILGS